MAEYEGRLPIRIGILGAAAIARKNVKAIGKTTKGIGRSFANGRKTYASDRLSMSNEK